MHDTDFSCMWVQQLGRNLTNLLSTRLFACIKYRLTDFYHACGCNSQAATWPERPRRRRPRKASTSSTLATFVSACTWRKCMLVRVMCLYCSVCMSRCKIVHTWDFSACVLCHVCVCMCVCVCYICTCVPTGLIYFFGSISNGIRADMCTRVYFVQQYVCMCICTRIYVNVHIYTFMWTCVHMYMDIYINAYSHVCICTWMCACVHGHVCSLLYKFEFRCVLYMYNNICTCMCISTSLYCTCEDLCVHVYMYKRLRACVRVHLWRECTCICVFARMYVHTHMMLYR